MEMGAQPGPDVARDTWHLTRFFFALPQSKPFPRGVGLIKGNGYNPLPHPDSRPPVCEMAADYGSLFATAFCLHWLSDGAVRYPGGCGAQLPGGSGGIIS